MQENKNIWILNHYAGIPNMPGGTRHYDFGKELIKRGYNVAVFASSFHHGLHKELKLNGNKKCKIEKVDGVNFIWIKTFPYKKNDWRRVLNMISYAWRVYWAGRRIAKKNKNIKKPDIVIGSSVHLLAVLAAYWLAKKNRAKFIMEVRDLWPQTLIDVGKFKKNSLAVKVLKLLEKFLYVKAQKIIITFPRGGDYIASLGINKEKIVWISNGVDLIRFKNFEKENIKGCFKVIYFGSHGLANALNVILDAALILQREKYESIKFVFIGAGTEKKNLIGYKNKLGLRNVDFLNPVEKQQSYRVLTEAGALILSLKKSDIYKYGISLNKLYDYMAAAKPIIFVGDSINNPINEVKCGISVPPENSEKMAEDIIKLYKMPSREREEMGSRGRKYVEKYHSIPVLVDKLEEVIREVGNE